MSRRVLTPAAALEIKRLYSIKNEWGVPMYSQSEIAGMLGVGETTVFRVLHKRGAYAPLPEVKTDADALASEEAFRKEHPELFGAQEKMAAAVAAEKAKVQLQEETLAELTQPGGAYDFVRREDE